MNILQEILKEFISNQMVQQNTNEYVSTELENI